MFEVDITQAYKYIVRCFNVGLVPFLKGPPGIGKSDIYKKIARDANLKLIDIRLAQCDQVDLNGFPFMDKATQKSFYAPPDVFPLVGEDLPDKVDSKGKVIGKYSGWLILLDEINSASLAVQAAAYKVVLDRLIGQKKLHPKVVMGCAGNLITDMAIVNRMSTAMQSRLIHINLMVAFNPFIDWAHKNAIDHRIISCLNFKPELLHNFNPKHEGDTFACPRTWAFTSKLIINSVKIPEEDIPLIIGTVGEGAGIEFHTHSEIFRTLPTKEDIIKSPMYAPLPTEPSTLFAITGLFSSFIEDKNAEQMMQYLNRLPLEFQIISMEGMVRRCTKLIKQNEHTMEWVRVNGDKLMKVA